MKKERKGCGFGATIAQLSISLAAIVYIWKSVKDEPRVIRGIDKGRDFAKSVKDKVSESISKAKEARNTEDN